MNEIASIKIKCFFLRLNEFIDDFKSLILLVKSLVGLLSDLGSTLT